MKAFLRLIACAVCVALFLSLASCADFGAGENEDDFKKYFSGVYVLSKKGAGKYNIGDFNRDISIEETDIPVIVSYGEYCYIGFRVADGYTLSLSEFAFFAKTQSGEGALELEFYIVDKMPTSIKNDDGEDTALPPLDEDDDAEQGGKTEEDGNGTQGGSDGDGSSGNGDESGSGNESDGNGNESDGNGNEADTEINEEAVFDPIKKFHASAFSIGQEWNSVLLQFDGSKTVESGQYVVVRINNNCYKLSDDEEETPSVSFTFNYLIFHFTDAHKE